MNARPTKKIMVANECVPSKTEQYAHAKSDQTDGALLLSFRKYEQGPKEEA